MAPPIQLFLTTIASSPQLRQRQGPQPIAAARVLANTPQLEYITRILQVKKIPYTAYDLASDSEAKRLWRRKAPAGKQELPGILVGNKWPGGFTEFEEAVEFGELDMYLRRQEEWDAELEGFSAPAAQPIGVPGVMMPAEMTGQKPSFAPAGSTPTPAIREGELDLGEELSGYGLQGVKVTQDELSELVKSLGLGDDDAADLVHGLDFGEAPATSVTNHDDHTSDTTIPNESLVSESDSDQPLSPSKRARTRKRTDERPLHTITPSASSSKLDTIVAKEPPAE